MVNPRQKCEVEPSLHCHEMMRDRMLSISRVELAVRRGSWVPVGGHLFVIAHGKCMAKVMVGVCNVRVVTVWRQEKP